MTAPVTRVEYVVRDARGMQYDKPSERVAHLDARAWDLTYPLEGPHVVVEITTTITERVLAPQEGET
jgi:hypothetical protein